MHESTTDISTLDTSNDNNTLSKVHMQTPKLNQELHANNNQSTVEPALNQINANSGMCVFSIYIL